jgi:hypothetical protein
MAAAQPVRSILAEVVEVVEVAARVVTHRDLAVRVL